MTEVWVAVAVVGIVTIGMRAAGPVLVAEGQLPAPVAQVAELLAPVVLAALVMTQTLGGDRELVVDERAAGLLAAGGVIALRGHMLLAALAAAVMTGTLRAI